MELPEWIILLVGRLTLENEALRISALITQGQVATPPDTTSPVSQRDRP